MRMQDTGVIENYNVPEATKEAPGRRGGMGKREGRRIEREEEGKGREAGLTLGRRRDSQTGGCCGVSTWWCVIPKPFSS